ncbi:sensor histidine kinase [Ureibacillus sinduriensis]|uniref:histidine kinase n=1 Tax=Ureibacillus sinduriensis BLB-1 = JCM 15800 TaxID=1384057 RepID=A0A0A3HSS9_9BACL|nr:HAMP domain-containing sensor histidine kinase [Ureibacillus sinduriensis]KGR75656.1 histidine kinase [Ureibacillus sinduriensis BLB-1 = JCM 15800]
MKSSGKLTFRFILYFVVFYLLIIIGTIGSILYFFFYLFDKVGNDIHTLDPFEMESEVLKTEDGYQLSDSLIEQAIENSGQVYLLNNQMKVLDYSGETCEVCSMTKEEIVQFDKKGLHTWKLPNHYLLFIPKSPLEPIFVEVYKSWTETGSIPPSFKQEMEKQSISIELYDERWKRNIVWGEKKQLLHLPDILANNSDIFEQKEWIEAKTLADGTTFVARMPNKLYKPFEEPLNRGIVLFIIFFTIFHIFLLIVIISLSLGISNRFVRPIVYILSRIERIARFDYKKTFDRKVHHNKSGKLKRKFKLFQPIDDSINHLADRLAYNERQLKRAEQLREEWITGLSHDLKTPLSSIYGYSTMLASNDYNWSIDEMRAFAKIMQEKANYMDALIQDLTFTYLLKNKAIELNKESVNLRDWLQAFQDEQVSVYSSRDVVIQADKLLLQRVVENIVSNAKNHTPAGTPIEIKAVNEAQSIVLSITDSGQGIPQADLDNLFDRYYRGTNTTDDIKGTGLGLAIAKQLIDLHNAKIIVNSDKHGTVFSIIFDKK